MAGKTKQPRAAMRKTVKPAGTKKAVRRKAGKSVKRLGALQRIETALMTGALEFDELALDMGLLGAAGPAPKKKRKKTSRR
jgi:hypothetical protein